MFAPKKIAGKAIAAKMLGLHPVHQDHVADMMCLTQGYCERKLPSLFLSDVFIEEPAGSECSLVECVSLPWQMYQNLLCMQDKLHASGQRCKELEADLDLVSKKATELDSSLDEFRGKAAASANTAAETIQKLQVRFL